MRYWIRPAILLAALFGVVLIGLAVRQWRRDRDPDLVFARARAELAAGRVAAAGEAIQRLGELRRPNEFDHLLRAQTAEAAGRPDEAIAELTQIGDRHPLAPLARTLTGNIEKKRSRLRPAEAAYLAAAALLPRSEQPRRELVYLYNLQHRQRELDAQLYALSELGVLEYDYLVHWAKTRNVVWNPERDTETLARCVAADPEDRASRLALAEGLQRMSQLDRATQVLEPLPVTDPPARALRAAIALDRGDEEGYLRITSGVPDSDPDLAVIRGRYALKEGNSDAAVRFFRVALAANPTDRMAVAGLGNALTQAGESEAARPYLEATHRAEEVTPLVTEAATNAGRQDPTLAARIGTACEAVGRDLEATAWFRRAIQRDPSDARSQAALNRIQNRIATH